LRKRAQNLLMVNNIDKAIHAKWDDMRQRCKRKFRPWDSRYNSYRHVTLYPEWNYFPSFHWWALTNGFKIGLWLDRKDNSKGYSPENCRWVTKRESDMNTSQVRRILCVSTGEIFDCMSDVARRYGKSGRSQGLSNAIRRGTKYHGLEWRYL
jgi:hypothetical protein